MMSKKQEFLQKEQNRDMHPERMMKGSAAEQTASAKGNPADHQVAGAGKVANDHNKQGEQAPTQKHEGQRTPESRHDRQNIGSGGHNEVTARKGGGGGANGGRDTRGAG